MEDLEVIIERFGDKHTRRRNLEAMHEQMMPYCYMPYDAVNALDVMVQKLIAGELDKQIVVVRSKTTANLTFTSILETKRGHIGYCIAHLFSRYFYLGGTSLDNKKVRFVIDPFNTITFDDLFGKGVQVFQLNGGEYFDCVKIPREIYDASSGVAIMKTTRNRGSFVIGTRRYDFGQDFVGKYIFTFFEDGNPLFFDVQGKMVFPTLSNIEVFNQKRLERILPIKEAYDSYTDDDSVEEYVMGLWKKAPEEYFDNPGVLLVRAEAQRSVLSLGKVTFYHYEDERKYKKIYAGIHEAGKNVKVSIRGGNLLIFSLEDELLNALFLSTPGVFVKHIRKTEIEEAVGIRTLRESSNNLVSLNKVTYGFAKARINELSYGADYRALMIHKHPLGNTYYLCLKRDYNISRHPLECTRFS